MAREGSRLQSAFCALAPSPLQPWRKQRIYRLARALEPHILLTEGVAHTLFDDYRNHRHSSRGEEEIGWVLLGLRQDGKAIALAALPAGTQREAGVAHVRFNSDAQELASRILRQKDKRLGMLGVVHTHPGSLRHPSAGDFQGDRIWVSRLRGGIGIFGIGTADARAAESQTTPNDHRQFRGELCFSWYALGARATRNTACLCRWK